MTTVAYAMGEVQELDVPMTRHAVADTFPGSWGVSVCPAKQRVWVHVVAGHVIPFPGPLGADLACPDCRSIAAVAEPSRAELFKQEKKIGRASCRERV